MSTSQLFQDAFSEARTRFTKQLTNLTVEDLTKKLKNTPNSAGFLIRHIGEVELLFAKNIFGNQDIQVRAKTVIDQCDTGEWTNLEELIAYIQNSHEVLVKIINDQSESDWQTTITTKEFGTKTKAEAFGRIISHTAYHAGQLAIILKYGE